MPESVPTTRRTAYAYKVHAPDFFVLRHLTGFTHSRVDRLVSSRDRVGDIGCGEQPLRSRITARGAEYVGIDVAQNSRRTVDIIAPITDIPLPAESFDVILCTEVLEHVSDTRAAFRELSRLLKPNAKLILTIPFAYPLHEEPYDFIRFTPYQLQACADAVQLRIIELERSGNELEVIATVWCNMWNRLPKSRYTLWHKYRDKLMRTPVNLLALVGSSLFGPVLPKKYFLNLMAVLEKRPASAP